MICGELRHDAGHLVASHRNQCDIVLIVGASRSVVSTFVVDRS